MNVAQGKMPGVERIIRSHMTPASSCCVHLFRNIPFVPEVRH